MQINIQNIFNRKKILEASILKLIQDFEQETELSVQDVELQHMTMIGRVNPLVMGISTPIQICGRG